MAKRLAMSHSFVAQDHWKKEVGRFIDCLDCGCVEEAIAHSLENECLLEAV